MKIKLSLILLFISISFLSCKKESAKTDDIQLTANASAKFRVSVILTDPNGKKIVDEEKSNLTSPYTYSLKTVKKGVNIFVSVGTLGGEKIDATLKVQGKVVQPQTSEDIFVLNKIWETDMP
jgi:hypothetical protein